MESVSALAVCGRCVTAPEAPHPVLLRNPELRRYIKPQAACEPVRLSGSGPDSDLAVDPRL